MIKYVFAVSILAILINEGRAEFNCTRMGVTCGTGGTCDNGTCVCNDPLFTGYDCTLDTRQIGKGGCLYGSPCQNGGTCYDPTPAGGNTNFDTARCYCIDAFYGLHCELSTVFNECFSDNMVVNVFPGKDFVGVVGVQGTQSFCDLPLVSSQVEFTLDPARSQWQGYAAALPFSGLPCGAFPSTSALGTEVTYTYDVIIRYDPSGANPDLDETIAFSCTVPSNVDIVKAEATLTTAVTPVIYSVTDMNGQFLSNPKLGSPFKIIFRADQNSGFNDVVINSCTVYNSNRSMSQQVVYNSCPLPPLGQSLEKRGADHILTLVTYMFPNNANLQFDCDVKVCQAGDVSCQSLRPCIAPSASGTPPGGMSIADIFNLFATQPGTAPNDPLLSLLAASGGVATNNDPFMTTSGGGATLSGGGAPNTAGMVSNIDPYLSTSGGGATLSGGGATNTGSGIMLTNDPMSTMLTSPSGGGATNTGGGIMLTNDPMSTMLTSPSGGGATTTFEGGPTMTDIFNTGGGADMTGTQGASASLNNILDPSYANFFSTGTGGATVA